MEIRKKLYDIVPMPLVRIWRLLKYPWVFMWNEIAIRYFRTYSVCRMYRAVFGVQPNFHEPKSLNEKLQILKLCDYYNNRFVSACIDKYQVKDILAHHFNVPNLKFAKTYAVFDNVKKMVEAGIEKYPQKFMIKCNHGCGYNLLCDKDHFDISSVSRQLDLWFKEEYWKRFAEYQYRFIKKRIFVEKFIEDIEDTYKFYCFNGSPRFYYVSSPDEQGNADVYLDFFDISGKHLDISLDGHKHKTGTKDIPACFNEMIEISRKLSNPFPFVRVDLYVVKNDIYFSELTFLPTGGYMHILPPDILYEWGNYLVLKQQ